MSQIPTLTKWLQLTWGGYLSPRSTILKELDKAIDTYHRFASDKTMQGVQDALLKWIVAKGDSWRSSARNIKYHAFENLWKVAYKTSQVPVNVADAKRLHAEYVMSTYGLVQALPELDEREPNSEALQYIQEARAKMLETLFLGSQFKLPFNKKGEILKDISSDLKEMKSGVDEFLKEQKINPVEVVKKAPIDWAQNFLSEAFGVESISDILGFSFSDILPELAAALTPWIGHIKSGADALYRWARSIHAEISRRLFKRHMVGIQAGTPAEAFNAVIEMLSRERNSWIRQASISTGDFAVRTGASFADLGLLSGPLLGVGVTLLKFLEKIYLLVRAYKEAKAANELLLTPTGINSGVFSVCPVVGAYFLANANTSDVVNFVLEDMGTVGWMDNIEYLLNEHVRPVIDRAKELIQSCPYKLEGMHSDKGNFAPKSLIEQFVG